MLKRLICLFSLISASKTFSEDRFVIMLEGGAAKQTRNDIQIPSKTGSMVAADQFDNGPFAHYRIEGFYRFKKNHAFRAVYAPFEVKLNGILNSDTNFNNQTFSQDEEIEVSYKFNSYRLSYLFGFWGFDKDQLNLGLTLKVRDADIRFTQNGRTTNYENVGLVPLFYFEYQKEMTNNWLINFNIDAATASQGRALDAAIKLRYQLSNLGQIGFGLRTLEGGANNDKVKTFSWFHYAVVDWVVSF